MACQALPQVNHSISTSSRQESQLQCLKVPGSPGEKLARGEARRRYRNHGDLERLENKHWATQIKCVWELHAVQATPV